MDGRQATGPVWSAPEPLGDRQAIQLKVHYALAAAPSRLTLAVSLFPYNPVHQTFVNIYEREAVVLQAIFGRDRQQVEFFPGTRQGTLAVVQRFAASGIHHILIGPDHILFLIGLLLLGGSCANCCSIVTHSRSPTRSRSRWRPSSISTHRLADRAGDRAQHRLRRRRQPAAQGGRDLRAWIAFAFGLVHGFGFANVLREIGLPQQALGWSLFSFNLGVELGQLAVVLVVASALALDAPAARSPDDGSPWPVPSSSWRPARSGSCSGCGSERRVAKGNRRRGEGETFMRWRPVSRVVVSSHLPSPLRWTSAVLRLRYELGDTRGSSSGHAVAADTRTVSRHAPAAPLRRGLPRAARSGRGLP